jgi:hypothetical protein
MGSQINRTRHEVGLILGYCGFGMSQRRIGFLGLGGLFFLKFWFFAVSGVLRLLGGLFYRFFLVWGQGVIGTCAGIVSVTAKAMSRLHLLKTKLSLSFLFYLWLCELLPSVEAYWVVCLVISVCQFIEESGSQGELSERRSQCNMIMSE